jgi:mRNA interferase MazF
MRRPALIVPHIRLNASKLATVLVIPLTTNVRRTAGLPRESVVNVSQLACVDRMLLESLQGTVPARIMNLVDDGLRLILDLQNSSGTLQ